MGKLTVGGQVSFSVSVWKAVRMGAGGARDYPQGH